VLAPHHRLPDNLGPAADEPIPFNLPFLSGKEIGYIADAVFRGTAASGGHYARRCQHLLSELLEGAPVLLTTSCTHALELAALLLDIGPGDEVVVPAYTFVSTANAFALRGARIVFADIRPDTMNLDETLLEDLITPRTRAVVPVHYAGVACEMDAIGAIAARHGVTVVEDNAHGLLATYKGRPLGGLGQLGTLSFHETKNFTCGEGGALVINDPLYAERAEILRDKGTNRARFFRGQVDKYTWVDLGSSYSPAEMLAAYLCAQLESRSTIQQNRRRIWDTYASELAGWAGEHGVQLPSVPAHCEQAYHMFYLVLGSDEARDGLIQHLRRRGINAVFHYGPLHRSDMAARVGAGPADCPVAESVSGRLVRLPFFTGLTDLQQARVVDAVTSFQPA
jgi:dTDP-4-amino-4,6-dideoxygalactose transaminase